MDARTSARPTTPARAPISPGRLLALLMAMTAMGPLILNILVPAVPSLIERMKTDAGTVQLTVSLFLVGLAVAQLVLGPLSDRFGRRPVVIGGLMLTAAASLGGLAVSSIGGLILARTLEAIGASTGVVIGRAIVRDLYERDRAAAMLGWVTTVMVVAPMVAPLIGGLLDTAFGWESIFVFVSAVSVAVLAWAYRTLPETRPEHVTGGDVRYIVGEARELFQSRHFIGYTIIAAFGTATFFCYLGGAPHLAISTMGMSSAEYGTWFMLSAFGYMIGNLMAARLSARIGGDRMIILGLAIQVFGTVLSLALGLFWLTPFTVFAPQFFIGMGNGVFLPNTIAGAISVRPLAAGTASGVTGFAQMGLGALAVQVMSHVMEIATDAIPLSIAMLILALVAVAGYAFCVRRGPRA